MATRFVFLILCLCSGIASAQTVSVLNATLVHPWALAFLPDGDFLVTEKGGRLKQLDSSGKLRQLIAGVPEVVSKGQGGLMDVAVHSDFQHNRWVYLTWSGKGATGTATHLGRGRLIRGRLTDFETLFVATPFVDSAKHFGSRISFDSDGHIFISVGDRGQRERAQNRNDFNGSILRLQEDGGIPQDNPFTLDNGQKSPVYSYGHRNPQGLCYDTETGQLWAVEHGPKGGDELNLIEKGLNYGWPLATYGKEYYGPSIGAPHVPGTAQPVHYWVPSIATSGLAVYRHSRFPQWNGNLFVGALGKTHLARLEMNPGQAVKETRLLDKLGQRIRDVRQGPDGFLYVLTDQREGQLLRLSP